MVIASYESIRQYRRFKAPGHLPRTDHNDAVTRGLYEAVEEAREAERAQRGKAAAGWLRADVVDLVWWEEYLQRPDVLNECARRAGVKPLEVLEVAMLCCRDEAMPALFWMSRWLEQVHGYVVEAMAREQIEAMLLSVEGTRAEMVRDDNARREVRKAASAAAHKLRHWDARARTRRALEEWQSGKYENKTLCAQALEAIYAGDSKAFGPAIDLESIRDYLKGRPDPDPWPARNA